MTTITVAIAEDEAPYRRALRQTLEGVKDIEIVADCANGQDAFDQVVALRPDVLLTDLVMPRMHGLELMRKLRPLGLETRSVVLTVKEDEDTICEAFHCGACGFLLKTATPSDVIEAIRHASCGETKVTPLVATRLVASFRRHAPSNEDLAPLKLSVRERDILRCLAAGMRNREIAEHLDITEKTVKNHVSNILRTLSVSTRTEAALAAVRHNLVRA